MLLSILLGTEQPTQQRIIQVKMSLVLLWRTLIYMEFGPLAWVPHCTCCHTVGHHHCMEPTASEGAQWCPLSADRWPVTYEFHCISYFSFSDSTIWVKIREGKRKKWLEVHHILSLTWWRRKNIKAEYALLSTFGSSIHWSSMWCKELLVFSWMWDWDINEAGSFGSA